jgi:hypothetical protein
MEVDKSTKHTFLTRREVSNTDIEWWVIVSGYASQYYK